jgi:hypothetical protein
MAVGAIVLGACEDDSGAGGADYAYGGFHDECHAFLSCGTCTPIEGCGWCFDSDGTGLCASSPDECTTPAFGWTWNPSGCRIPADASTTRESGAGIAPAVGDDAALSSETDGATRDDAAEIDAGSAPGDAAGPDGDGSTPVEVPLR